jgi:hypothetical protein
MHADTRGGVAVGALCIPGSLGQGDGVVCGLWVAALGTDGLGSRMVAEPGLQVG